MTAPLNKLKKLWKKDPVESWEKQKFLNFHRPCTFYFNDPNDLIDGDIKKISSQGATLISSNAQNNIKDWEGKDFQITISFDHHDLSLKARVLPHQEEIRNLAPDEGMAIQFKYKNSWEALKMKYCLRDLKGPSLEN